QAERKEFTINYAFGQSRGDAAAYSGRELLNRGSHLALVSCFERRDAVSHHNPLDIAVAPIRHQAALAAFPDEFCVEARTADIGTVGIASGEQVEVKKAVVHWRDQRVGRRMAQP